MELVVLVVIGVLCIGGALAICTTAVAILRVPDALSRINVLGPGTVLGPTPIVVAAFVHHTWREGFDGLALFQTLVAVFGFVVVSSVATNTLARAAYRSGAPIDPRTDPNELAEEPREDRAG